MVTTLRILDGEQYLPIDKATSDRLGIDPQTPLDVVVDGGRITVAPSEPARRVATCEQVKAAVEQTRPSYERMLRKLAE